MAEPFNTALPTRRDEDEEDLEATQEEEPEEEDGDGEDAREDEEDAHRQAASAPVAVGGIDQGAALAGCLREQAGAACQSPKPNSHHTLHWFHHVDGSLVSWE